MQRCLRCFLADPSAVSESSRDAGASRERFYLIPVRVDAALVRPVASDSRVFALGGQTMGTNWTLRFVSADSIAIAEIEAALEGVFARVISQMSNWEANSSLSAFNRAPSGWVEIPDDFRTVLSCALEVAALTDGAFNPTLHAAVTRLGFGPEPDDAIVEIDGWRAIALDAQRGAAFQPGRAMLDFSSIAKGYAVDLCAKELAEIGIESFLMEIGGEFVGRGLRPDGQPWRVELQLAGDGCQPADVMVALTGMAVATSGDFVRTRQLGGKSISHLLDGRTGEPMDGSLSGVSVMDVSCMSADAWATALFALGPVAGLELANEQGLAAVFAVRQGSDTRLVLSRAARVMLD